MSSFQRLFARLAGLLLALTLAPALLAAGSDDFFRAIAQNNAGAMRQLLAAGADPNLKNEQGVPSLNLALQEEALQVVDVLLDSPRLEAEQRNTKDESPLMMAALKGELGIVRRLIKLGAHVNKPGWAPLHYAATGGHVEVIDLLLEKHAFIDAESPNGTTPLMMAAFYGTPEAVKLLIESGADLNMRNQQGMTALDFAQRAERKNAMELIVDGLRLTQGAKPGQW